MYASLRICQLLVAVTLTAACGARQPPAHEQPDRQGSQDAALSSQELSGKIFVTGSRPHTSVTLVPDQGRGVTLAGDLRGELARLSGAEVRVRGVERGKPPAGGFDVESYEVTGIDGEVPQVGVLSEAGGSLTLLGADTLVLSNVPEELRNQEGAKVWIVGAAGAGELAVQSYGVLREGK